MATAKKKLILLVEDDADILDSLKELLQDEGYEVMTAANGQYALERLVKGPRPDLILLDLMMPIMDGFQFREAQLGNPEFAKIPVLIMSADGHIEKKMAQTKTATYLKKPVDVEVFLQTIVQQLGSGA